MKIAKVAAVHRHEAPIVKLTLASGKVIRCTPDHRWLSHPKRNNSPYVTPKVGRVLTKVVEEPGELSDALMREASWLGGIYDGEGSLSGGSGGKGGKHDIDHRGQIVIAQSPEKNPEVCERIERTLKILGIPYSIWKGSGGCNVYALTGGRQAKMNFATWCRPAKAPRLKASILRSWFEGGDKIVKIEPEGEGAVIGLTTTTGNYVAWGYASKNCGRLRHYGWDKKKGDWNWASSDSEPEVKGLEWKRGDANKIARELQWEAICLICAEDRNVAMDPSRYVEIADRYKKRVMEDPLTVDEVKQAKALSKETDDYVAKKKKDGTDSAVQAHVRVARILEQRGEAIVVNSKIDFVISDGSKDRENGLVAIPADDYDGTNADRHYLWEHLVWPPTFRLLEAAFPDRDWRPWNRTRPTKRERKAAEAGQGGLFGIAQQPALKKPDPAHLENLRFLTGKAPSGAR